MNKFILLLLFSVGVVSVRAQTCGCTDVLARNYNALATVNDGSCTYNKAKVVLVEKSRLPQEIKESSGLILWDSGLWTHNDDTDVLLYCIDTVSGSVLKRVEIAGVKNTDWEEIEQDSLYVYVGDFGNNYKGNRTDLGIIKARKTDLLLGRATAERISFSYEDQRDFKSPGTNRTNFDCEAMVVASDSLFLFTKQWSGKCTTVYVLPNTPGSYKATPVAAFNVKGLVTGAVYLEEKKLLVLCGYERLGSPFLYLFYDFKGHNFFSGNKRRIAINAGILQVEGITTTDGLHYYLSCENLIKRPLINSPARIFTADLSEYLHLYIDSLRR